MFSWELLRIKKELSDVYETYRRIQGTLKATQPKDQTLLTDAEATAVHWSNKLDGLQHH